MIPPAATATPRVGAVPAPSGGNTAQVIPPGQPGPVTQVDLSQPATLKGGVTVSLSKITEVETKAETPGEIAGPAVAVHVLIQNDSDSSINVDSAIVTLTDAHGDVGQPTTSDPYRAFAGDIAPGASGEGVYVFLTPKNNRNSLTLSVEYVAGAPIAHFVGAVS